MLIHSSADGHVGYLHFLAVMNDAAMNACVQVLHGQVFTSLGSLFRSGAA